MGFYRGPHIVTDGLVLSLDAGNTKSYQSGSTTWFDKSGNGNNGILTNVGFDSTKQCLLFSSSSQSRCVIGNSTPVTNFNNGSFSIETVFRIILPAVGTVNSLFNKRLVITGIGGFKGYTYRVLANTANNAGTIISVDNGTGSNNGDYTVLGGLSTTLPYYGIIDLVLVFNASTLKLSEYRNGVLHSNTNSGAMTGSSYSNNSDLILGKGEGNSLDAEYYSFKAYNRVLSAQEILQNFDATKSRYGL
jgi:hypothetical protein